jgi:hypothetical protein
MDVVQSTCEKKLFQILGGSVGENRGKWEAVFHWFQYGGSADNEIHIELPNEEFHFHIKLLYGVFILRLLIALYNHIWRWTD